MIPQSAQVPAQSAQQSDPKTQVNQFCQKKTGRTIGKTDITYNTVKHGNVFQSTITLGCLGGVAFVGELVGTAKDAEKMAAAQVVKHYAAEIAQLNAEPKTKNKRPAAALGGTGILQPGPPEKSQKVDADQTPSGPQPPKKEIHEICMKIAKRQLSKTDLVYNTGAVAGGFQSTLQLSCLPGVYGQNLFTGTVCPNKKEAEISVATIAVSTLRADAEMAEIIDKPKEVKTKGKGKGKSKGKSKDKGEGGEKGGGKGGGTWDGPSFDFGGGMDPMMAMMTMMLAGGFDAGGGGRGAGGKKKKSTEAGERKRVSTAKVSGTVEEWKGKFGWIKPAAPFEHEKAKQNRGKIYLSMKDVPSGKEMKAGTSISFHVYADNSGLGAEDCE